MHVNTNIYFSFMAVSEGPDQIPFPILWRSGRHNSIRIAIPKHILP